MGHVIFGGVLLLLGLWGIFAHWYQFVDLMWVLIPLAVLIFGIEFLVAGIAGMKDT